MDDSYDLSFLEVKQQEVSVEKGDILLIIAPYEVRIGAVTLNRLPFGDGDRQEATVTGPASYPPTLVQWVLDMETLVSFHGRHGGVMLQNSFCSDVRTAPLDDLTDRYIASFLFAMLSVCNKLELLERDESGGLPKLHVDVDDAIAGGPSVDFGGRFGSFMVNVQTGARVAKECGCQFLVAGRVSALLWSASLVAKRASSTRSSLRRVQIYWWWRWDSSGGFLSGGDWKGDAVEDTLEMLGRALGVDRPGYELGKPVYEQALEALGQVPTAMLQLVEDSVAQAAMENDGA